MNERIGGMYILKQNYWNKEIIAKKCIDGGRLDILPPTECELLGCLSPTELDLPTPLSPREFELWYPPPPTEL